MYAGYGEHVVLAEQHVITGAIVNCLEVHGNGLEAEVRKFPEYYSPVQERVLSETACHFDELAHGSDAASELILSRTEHEALDFHPVGVTLQVGAHGHLVAVAEHAARELVA